MHSCLVPQLCLLLSCFFACWLLSKQVLSQGRAQEMGHIKDSVRASAARRERLLEEVLGYASDVVCLQDVDFAADFWQPKLGVAGYGPSLRGSLKTKSDTT